MQNCPIYIYGYVLIQHNNRNNFNIILDSGEKYSKYSSVIKCQTTKLSIHSRQINQDLVRLDKFTINKKDLIIKDKQIIELKGE